jgi:phospholipid/cholesterol/gamma-HCH transport system ATP-binding protein
MEATVNAEQLMAENNENSTPAIAVENLTKSFGSQRVLNGISFEVRRGDTLAILGRSGTGKSVTLRILVGLEPPDQGSARILGTDMNAAGEREVGEARKQMGFLFQHAALYDSLTVAENVAFPLTHHRRDLTAQQRTDRVHELLAEVGLEGHGEKMPADISGGMQKRVGLARALALDPVVLLLDEPTAGLDPISSAEIDQLVMKLQKEHNLASIVVTHDMVSARTIATRIALMDKGKIVIEGTFEELQRSRERFVTEFMQRDMERT